MPRANQRQALGWLGLLCLALLGRGVVDLYTGITSNEPRALILGSMYVAMYILCFIGLVFVRRKATTRAIWAVFAGIYFVSIVLNLVVSGVGISMALSMPLVVIALAYFIIPDRDLNRVLFTTAFVSLVIITIDFFYPAGRITNNEAQNSLSGFIFVLITIYAYIIYRRFPSFNLRTKLITVTAVVATAAVFTVAFFEARLTSNAISAQVGNNLHNLADSQALAIGELLARQINILETLALNPATQASIDAQNQQYTGTRTEIENQLRAIELAEWERGNISTPFVTTVTQNDLALELRRFQSAFPEYVDLVIADEHGGLVASTTANVNYYVGEQEWWISAYAVGFGSAYLSEPIPSNNQTSLLEIAIPVRLQDDAGARIVGVLYASYSLNALGDILTAAKFGNTGGVKIQTLNNQEIAVNDTGRVQLSSISLNEIEAIQELQNSSQVHLTTELFGETKLLSQSTVNTLTHEPQVDLLGWRVIVSQAQSEALQTVDDQQQANIILGFIVVIIASGIAAGVAGIIANPITRLINVANRVTNGDLTAQAHITSTDEFGQLATAFNEMTSQLQNAIVNLEARVGERTQDLETITEVSRNLSTVLEPERLVAEIVERVRDAYDYYYVQIYLLDENQRNLSLAAGTGPTGQAMRRQGHQLAVGQGIVGQAVIRNSPVLVRDVTRHTGWLPNPLLPDTKTELAIPISIGSQVLGVLDVQHDAIGRLTSNDINVLQSIASQITIALRNAQTYAETQRQAEQAEQINSINQKIQQATTIEEVLQIAGEAVSEKLGSTHAAIRLGVQNNGKGG